MIAAQIHPEHLLDQSRRGSLTARERGVLHSHLSECSACRFELSVAPLYCHMDLGPDDRALVGRALARRRQQRYESSGVRRSAASTAALVAGLLIGGAVASAGAYVSQTTGHSRPTIEAIPRATVVVERSLPAAPIIVPAAEPAAVTVRPSLPPPPAVVAARRASAPRPRAIAVSAVSVDQCADLFQQANQVRREGDSEQAANLYHTLGRACPGSSEELSGRVLLGRLYLDRLADPRQALAAFDSYLTTPSQGPLREDALIGRALALGHLDRVAEETQAWQALLSSYPDSLYGDRARRRLAQQQ